MPRSKKQMKSGRKTGKNIGIATSDQSKWLESTVAFRPWIEYSEQLQDQITDALKENRNQYENLYNGWRDFSESMATSLKTTMGEESPEYRELFNVWKNYANKMGARLTKLVNQNRTHVETLGKMYQDYSKNMTVNIEKKTGEERDIFQDLYSSWFDFFNNMNSQILGLFTINNQENDKALGLWEDFTSYIESFIDSVDKENKNRVTEFQTTWNSLSEKFGDTIMGFVDGYNKNYENVYNTWLNETKEIGRRFSEIMKDFGTDYENLYKMYFDRTGSFQRNLMIFPYLRAQNLADEVKELKKKIEGLEKKLNEHSS